MINLLPPKEKEELLLEKNKKLVIVLGNIVVISLICLSLILFSLKFYILGEISYQQVTLSNAQKRYQSSALLPLRDTIQKYNASLIKIDDFYKKEIYFSDALKTILTIQRPKGVFLTSIVMGRTKEDDTMKVTLSGVSDTRDNLLVFKDNIESRGEIKNTYFPPESWVKDKDITFYLTFEIIMPISAK